MKIFVTDDDIKKANNSDGENELHCPIAIAFERQFHEKCWVEYKTIRITGGNVRKLPKIAKEFIKKYDAEEKVSPFVFSIQKWS